jgi:DNA topoisomerase-2
MKAHFLMMSLIESSTVVMSVSGLQMRFILAVAKNEIIVSNRKKLDLLHDIKDQGFQAFYDKKKTHPYSDPSGMEDGDPDDAEDADPLERGYDYLLSMKIWSLTLEKVEALNQERNAMKAKLNDLQAKAPEQLWLDDLDKLETALDEFEAASDDSKKQELAARNKSQPKTLTRKPSTASSTGSKALSKPKSNTGTKSIAKLFVGLDSKAKTQPKTQHSINEDVDTDIDDMNLGEMAQKKSSYDWDDAMDIIDLSASHDDIENGFFPAGSKRVAEGSSGTPAKKVRASMSKAPGSAIFAAVSKSSTPTKKKRALESSSDDEDEDDVQEVEMSYSKPRRLSASANYAKYYCGDEEEGAESESDVSEATSESVVEVSKKDSKKPAAAKATPAKSVTVAMPSPALKTTASRPVAAKSKAAPSKVKVASTRSPKKIAAKSKKSSMASSGDDSDDGDDDVQAEEMPSSYSKPRRQSTGKSYAKFYSEEEDGEDEEEEDFSD